MANPVQELTTLRSHPLGEHQHVQVDPGHTLGVFDTSSTLQTAFDLEAVFTLPAHPEGMQFQMDILANSSKSPYGVVIDVNVSAVDIPRGVRTVIVSVGVPRGNNAKLNVTSEFEYGQEEVSLPLRVLVDRIIVEVFVGNGACVMHEYVCI